MSSLFDRLTGRDKTQIPLYEDDGFDAPDDAQWQRQAWLTFAGRHYGVAVASALCRFIDPSAPVKDILPGGMR